MALKRKINKTTFDKLSEEIKKEYKAGSSDDEFILDTEGDEDTGALKRAKDREAQLRREAEEKLREATEKLEGLESGDARKKGDIETLEKSWKKKLDDKEKELGEKLTKAQAHIQRTLVDNVAKDIAHKISNAPALLLPHIRSRIVADLDGDEPVTRVLDANGKPSALTVEDLQKEFVANKDFSAIILASKASGGAGKPSNGTGGGAPTLNQPDKPADLSKLNPSQMVEHLKAVKANQQV